MLTKGCYMSYQYNAIVINVCVILSLYITLYSIHTEITETPCMISFRINSLE